MKRLLLAMAGFAAGLLVSGGLSGQIAIAAGAKTVEVKGEIIDTWCYLSGVMGGTDAVVGSAHHTCALWCAAGGIPVGVRADDGTVYMVLKIKGEDPLALSDTILELQSDSIVANGQHYVRDGVNYLVVANVVSNDGITNRNHEDFGVVPGFAIPEKK
ncbi:MAG: hypothetical protein APF80_09935 [Alphaproteobacteria bacterium BRH_c36]|nr:MAG: hypothetical protein APF80_09935 [Alphaproteobacteria bacterium BRH_c36]